MTPFPAAAAPSEPSIRLRSAEDVIGTVPYLLGFHPDNSLVFVGLSSTDATDRVEVVARVDRPGNPAELTELLTHTVDALQRSGADRTIALFYGAPPAVPQVDALRRATRTADLRLLDIIAVGAGRWRSVSCSNPRCCPPEGHALPAAPTPVQTAAAVAGLVARPSRAELADLVRPRPEPERTHLQPLLAAADDRRRQRIATASAGRWQRSAVRTTFAATRRLGVLDDEQVAELLVAVRDQDVRDACWLAVDERRVDGEALWRELATRAPAPYSAAPYFLFGWLQWRAGNGTLARIAAEHALQADPDYRAADLLLAALHRGLNPFRSRRLRSYRRGTP